MQDEHYDTISAFIKRHARERSRAGPLLDGEDDYCRGGTAVHRAQDRDRGERKDVGKRGPARAVRGGVRLTQAVERIGHARGGAATLAGGRGWFILFWGAPSAARERSKPRAP